MIEGLLGCPAVRVQVPVAMEQLAALIAPVGELVPGHRRVHGGDARPGPHYIALQPSKQEEQHEHADVPTLPTGGLRLDRRGDDGEVIGEAHISEELFPKKGDCLDAAGPSAIQRVIYDQLSEFAIPADGHPMELIEVDHRDEKAPMCHEPSGLVHIKPATSRSADHLGPAA